MPSLPWQGGVPKSIKCVKQVTKMERALPYPDDSIKKQLFIKYLINDTIISHV